MVGRTFALRKQFLHYLLHGYNFLKLIDIRSGEKKPLLCITLYGGNQSMRNTVFHCSRVTAVNTAGAVLRRNSSCKPQLFQEGTLHRSSRHSHRTVNDIEIFLPFTDKILFIGITCVTFLLHRPPPLALGERLLCSIFLLLQKAESSFRIPLQNSAGRREPPESMP